MYENWHNWRDMAILKVNNKPAEFVEKFSYIGSAVTDTGNCDKEIKVHMGKANSSFKRLDCIWRKTV